jgi:hypothetical protein
VVCHWRWPPPSHRNHLPGPRGICWIPPLGSDRARMSSAQRVRRQYENISFLDGESLDDFMLRLGKMVHELEILGDPEESCKVAAKYLRIVPKKFVPVAVSIMSLLDTTSMSIEEITGRLGVAEGRGDDEDADPPTVAGNKLLLTKEQWQARMKEKLASGEGSSKSEPSKGGSKNRSLGHRKNKNSGGKDDCDTYLNCGKKGHWAKDRRLPRKEKANLAKEDDEESLLTARVCELTVNSAPPQGKLHLDEPRGHIFLGSDGDDEQIEGCWYLDTVATSHMIERAVAFLELDRAIQGTICFGDSSLVEIEGRDIVEFTGKIGEVVKLVGVLYIPRLKNNIISLGQLDERGCKVEIEKGLL